MDLAVICHLDLHIYSHVAAAADDDDGGGDKTSDVFCLLCTEAKFDTSPTWLYVVCGITFVFIIVASVIVLVCR